MNKKHVLISIKPCFVEQILAGTKTFEFRKQWTKEPVDRLVIYSSSPKQRIVAVTSILSVAHDTPENLIKLAAECGDTLNNDVIANYFAGKEKGFALKLGEIHCLPDINPRQKWTGFVAPQSYSFLRAEKFRSLSLE